MWVAAAEQIRGELRRCESLLMRDMELRSRLTLDFIYYFVIWIKATFFNGSTSHFYLQLLVTGTIAGQFEYFIGYVLESDAGAPAPTFAACGRIASLFSELTGRTSLGLPMKRMKH